MISKSKDRKNLLDSLLLGDKILSFKKGDIISMNTIIGSFRKCMTRGLLTIQQEEDLFELCNLNHDADWRLIYQATRDRFSF